MSKNYLETAIINGKNIEVDLKTFKSLKLGIFAITYLPTMFLYGTSMYLYNVNPQDYLLYIPLLIGSYMSF